MKKAIGCLMAVMLLGLFLSGCATPYPYGALYTEIKAPVSATGNVSYSKVGVSKATSVFGLVATGDCSIKAAVENGGIRTVKYVDYEAKNILGIIGEYITTVYGD